jgi:hypothetical protein
MFHVLAGEDVMKIKKILVAGIAAALITVPTILIAKDVRDPGRLPRPDRDRDQPAPVVAVGTATNAIPVTAQKEDVRDPGHIIVPDKSKDTVRRR